MLHLIDEPSQKLMPDTFKAVADEEVAKRAILALPADQSALQPSQNFLPDKKRKEVVYRRVGPQKYPKGARIQATAVGCRHADEPTTLSEDWIGIGAKDLHVCPCNMEKDAGPTWKRRRTPGATQTFLLHGGVLLH